MNLLRTVFLAALCLLPLAASAQSYTPVTKVYLRLNGIIGDSQDQGHVGDIEIMNASFGVSQAGLALSGGGAGATRSQFTPITIQKAADKTSPLLFVNCALGKSITSAKISFRNIGGPQAPYDYLTIDLGTVFISSFNIDCTNGDALVNETVGIAYGAMKITFQPLNGAPISQNFSVVKNKSLPDVP